MNNDQNIDRLFRERLYSRDIPFDGSGWAEAEKMLDDQKKKRFFLYRFRYYLSAIIALAILFVGLNSLNNTNVEQKNTRTSNSSAHTNKYESKSQKKKLTNYIENENSELSYSNLNSSETISNQEKIENTNQEFEDIKRLNVNSLTKRAAPTLNSKDIITQKAELPLLAETNSFSESSKNKPPNTSSSIGSSSSISSNSSEILSKKSNAVPIGLIAMNTDEDVQLNSVNTNWQYMNSKLAPENIVDELDLMLPEEKINNEDPIKRRSKGVRGLKFHAGAGLTKGTKSEGQGGSIGLSYFIGLSYERKIIENWTVEIGLLGSRRNAYGVVYESERTEYDFGYVTSNHLYEFKDLFFTEIPLLVHRNIFPRHKVGLGLKYSFLTAVNYSVKENETSTFESGTITTTNEFGIPSALNVNDLGILLNYDFMINERWNIAIQYQYGLLNGLKTDYFIDQFERNSQLRLYLTYKLYK